MGKLLDKLLGLFIEIYTIFLYCLVIPLGLGLIWLIGNIAEEIIRFGLENPFMYIGASIILGVWLKLKYHGRFLK